MLRLFLFSLITGGLGLSSVAFAQTNPDGQSRQQQAQGRAGSGRAAAPSPTGNPLYNARDLSGFWYGGGIPFGPGNRFSLGTPAPPMTKWAKARYDAAIPGIGAGGGNYPANLMARPLGNDPIMLCDPVGFPRIILTLKDYGMQVVQRSNEMIWLFDWFYTRRVIWTDGRRLPKDPDPRFYGYSVGHWEGDTFVVESNGFDDRSWLDDDGHPHSDEMRLTERYHRMDHNTIELTMTITDPKAYTQPWVSAPMYLHWLGVNELNSGDNGWKDLREDVCIPSQEARYKDLIREPAGTPDVNHK